MKLLYCGLLFFLLVCNCSAFSWHLSEADSLMNLMRKETGYKAKAALYISLSDNFTEVHDYVRARKYLDSAFVLSKIQNYEPGIAAYYLGLGSLLYMQDNYHDALENYAVALNRFRKTGDSLQVAKVCLKMGIACNALGNYNTGSIYLEHSLQLAVMKGDKSLQKKIYDRLSVDYTFHGNYREAIRCIDNARNLALEGGNKSEVVKSDLYLGIIYKHQGNHTKALEIFLKAIQYYEQTVNKEELIRLDNCIGGMYLDQEEYPEALSHLNTALKYSRELGLDADVASNLALIGLVYCEQQKYDEALRVEFQALEIYTGIGNKNGICSTWFNIGRVYEGAGKKEKALESYHRSLSLSEEIHDNETKATCLSVMAVLLVKRAMVSGTPRSDESYDEARDYLRRSLDLALEMGRKEQVMTIYKTFYRIDSATGDPISQLKHFKLYTLYKDSLYNIESNNQLVMMQVQFDREQKNREIMLLTTSKELQKLQLEKISGELANNKTELEKQKAELETTRQIKELREREIERQKMQRNGILFTALLMLVTGLIIIRVIRLRKQLEKQQAVSKERERISADLHDDIGSGLSKIILMLEVMNREAESPEIKSKARLISNESLELSRNMSEVIWALNSRNDNLESLVAYIRKYAGNYFENSVIKFKMSAPAHVPTTYLSSEQRRNVFYAIREALHNVVKHANATEVELLITCDDRQIAIVIRDNGVGLPDGELNRFGNGIIQMRTRLSSIGGDFTLQNGVGTTVKLSLPV